MKRSELSGESTARLLNGREVLFVRLVMETAKWRERRAKGWGSGDKELVTQRGIVRGMAIALTKMFGNGYEPYWSQEIKECERYANSLAVRWLEDGSPENDNWWLEHSRSFWRSASDAASPDQRELRRQRYRA